MTATLIPASPTASMTAADRCDRCGARAATRIVLANGTDLVFCGHHARRYDADLREIAIDILPAS